MDYFKCTRVVKEHACSINEPEAAPKKADPSADAKEKRARKKNVISSASLEVVYDLVKADAAVALYVEDRGHRCYSTTSEAQIWPNH